MAAEQRREQLLDAALDVIVEEGYRGVSVEAVARAAGVTRPVIYDHFRDLAELLRALIEREERYSLDQLDRVLPEAPDRHPPARVFSECVSRFLLAVASRPATWTLILLPSDGTPEIVRQHVQANRDQLLTRLQDAVRWAIGRSATSAHAEGQAEAGVRDEVKAQRAARTQVDVELAARAILGLAEDAGRMVLTDPERYSPARYEEFVASVMSLLWPA